MATSDTIEGGFRSAAEMRCWLTMCAGKEKYPSFDSAEAHARLLYRSPLHEKNRNFPRQKWNKLTPYECLFIPAGEKPHFHLGHPPG